ncbi:portal protein, partial [Streptococcus mitis]|uniref:portal protein n=1 Tax=Streptococcus mitis TaxID=28037 RepID=UPI0021B80EC2
NKTSSGITQIMNASQQRIELIARIFAETGVKSLMRLIQALSIKNGRKQEIIKLRNKWVPVNPGEWKRRTDMTVSVGLGVGN